MYLFTGLITVVDLNLKKNQTLYCYNHYLQRDGPHVDIEEEEMPVILNEQLLNIMRREAEVLEMDKDDAKRGDK